MAFHHWIEACLPFQQSPPDLNRRDFLILIIFTFHSLLGSSHSGGHDCVKAVFLMINYPLPKTAPNEHSTNICGINSESVYAGQTSYLNKNSVFLVSHLLGKSWIKSPQTAHTEISFLLHSELPAFSEHPRGPYWCHPS